MPVQNVIQHTPLDGGLGMTMMQNNRTAINNGSMATSERMYAARDPVSNFGTEVHVGRGQFSQNSRETLEVSVESISRAMQRDDEFEASKIGDYSALGPTGFQDYNNRSYQSQQQVVAKAYEYFKNYSQLE